MKTQHLFPTRYQVRHRDQSEILIVDTVNETFYIMQNRTRNLYHNVQLESVYSMIVPSYAVTIDASQ